MILIEGENVSLGYDGIPIIEDINFKINGGDYLCIVGENGTGKSTFVKTLLTLIEPLKGRIEFKNGFTNSKIGYLPQQSLIQQDFPSSVMEVVLSGCLNNHKRLFGYSREEKERAYKTIERLGMSEYVKTPYQELSGGQKQRVLLSRALMATDQLILLDEPVTGLDPKASSELYSIISDLNKSGITVIMITHDIHPALNDARTIMHFSHKSYFFGSRDDYFKSEPGRIFLKEAGHAGDSF